MMFAQLHLTRELRNEIITYRNLVTDPIACREYPAMIQRPVTFERFTLCNIRCFLQWMRDEQGHRVHRFKSLYPYIEKHLIEYTEYLYRKAPTQSVHRRTNTFLIMLERFFKRNINQLRMEIQKVYRLPIESGIRTAVYEVKKNVPINSILPLLNHHLPRTRLIANLLIRMGWRSQNIRLLRSPHNIQRLPDGWYYRFAPSEQKSPWKINGVLQTISGKFPSILSDLLDEFSIPSNGYLFHRDGQSMHVSWLNAYTKKTCMLVGVPVVCPHAIRSIVSTAYALATRDVLSAETWLWHKVKASGSMLSYIRPNFDLAVQRVNEYIDGLLVGDRIPSVPPLSPVEFTDANGRRMQRITIDIPVDADAWEPEEEEEEEGTE
jgi:hypothetical protein